MTKITNPHMSLPLTNPMVGASHIEIHDKFVITYRDTINYSSGRESGKLFMGHAVLNEAIFK